MNFRKFFSGAAISAFMLFAAMPARAGIPVIDAANLANSIQQVIAWGRQAQDMINQLNQLQQQFAQLQTMTTKLDGIRNLARSSTIRTSWRRFPRKRAMRPSSW